eukprot:TRINITY_DN3749_c0_g1_i1.p1 TRINITY_DN3749_c0_g1~~TRINITY_DN3749_c0_g1_i1.p1  ORF type:complete len:449 (-),score=16.24 TRINITY_DN3749_c0_g1_i1:375-1541(-)
MTWSALTNVDLRYGQGINCRGGRCPEFESCHSGLIDTSLTEVDACYHPDLADEDDIEFPPYFKANRSNVFTGQITILHNVFINGVGVIFDHKHVYEWPDDCLSGSRPHNEYSTWMRSFTLLGSLSEVATIAHKWGSNHYHKLIEVTGALFELLPLLRRKPFIPVLQFHQAYYSLLDIQPEELDILDILSSQVYFVQRLFVPTPMACMRPGRALIKQIRSEHFNFSSPRQATNTSDGGKEATSIPPDWVIILGVREKGIKRSIVGWEEILVKLRTVLPVDRIEIYDGHLGIHKARDLFRRARFYMGPHGGGLANIIFLPPWGEVLEITTPHMDSLCFKWLTLACNLKYTSFVGEGTVSEPITVNETDLVSKVTEIAKGFPSTATWKPAS